MASVARLRAGAEDLARVVGSDLVLVAVGSNDADVVQPFLVPDMIARSGHQEHSPRRAG